MSISEDYPYVLQAAGVDFKRYYNSYHYMMVSNPYMAGRYKTIDAASKEINYVKSNYEDGVQVSVVLFEDAYKEYKSKYQEEYE